MPHAEPAEDQDYSLLEEVLHSVSHGIGAILSLAGMLVLLGLALAMGLNPLKLVGLGLYGISLVLLYTASTLYHAIRHPLHKYWLQRLDHCAIYLLIAGTYSPFLLVNLRGTTGWTLLAVVWTLAMSGIAVKLAWPQRFATLRVAIYLVMGWLIVVAGDELVTQLSASGIALLVAGGLAYSVGVIFYAVRAIPFNHAIWHLFVIAGSACHYAAVYTEVIPYPT